MNKGEYIKVRLGEIDSFYHLSKKSPDLLLNLIFLTKHAFLIAAEVIWTMIAKIERVRERETKRWSHFEKPAMPRTKGENKKTLQTIRNEWEIKCEKINFNRFIKIISNRNGIELKQNNGHGFHWEEFLLKKREHNFQFLTVDPRRNFLTGNRVS